MRIALVGSSGGHLTHLLALRDLWQNADRFWVTFPTADARGRLANERVYWCYHPTNRNIPNLILNTLLAARILRRERPDVILSSGAAAAVPFAYLARAVGARFVFIEVVDRVNSPTATGRLVQPVAHVTVVQWERQMEFYKNAVYVGRII